MAEQELRETDGQSGVAIEIVSIVNDACIDLFIQLVFATLRAGSSTDQRVMLNSFLYATPQPIIGVFLAFSPLRAGLSGPNWGKLAGNGVGGVFWLSNGYGRQTGRVG